MHRIILQDGLLNIFQFDTKKAPLFCGAFFVFAYYSISKARF